MTPDSFHKVPTVDHQRKGKLQSMKDEWLLNNGSVQQETNSYRGLNMMNRFRLEVLRVNQAVQPLASHH